MLSFDPTECETDDFEIILPASVSSRNLRCTITHQFETDKTMVVAQAQTRPAAMTFPNSGEHPSFLVYQWEPIELLVHLYLCNVQRVGSTAKDGAGSACFHITCLVLRLTSFCLLRLLVVCGDNSFSSIYLRFTGSLSLFVVRMYWGVVVPS
ncbi:hypothetical protein Cgig2_030351 [Carnegiea gigantea]|uniref:Uncharacterized protein n=1 Tax=Carnegiea gigantea TaxID=171969 RepID=A0A9Q1KL62_9CARY|nr:hypothetical protein Cgig2_030351 [Carnegiea gigantea]